jgi:hypothetical protein
MLKSLVMVINKDVKSFGLAKDVAPVAPPPSAAQK